MYNSTFPDKPRKPLTRSGFKKKDPSEMKPMKRTAINKVGRIGKANLKANKKIKELELPEYCEIRFNKLDECLGFMYLTNAHRHKRAWYKGNVELLSDKRQVVKACVNCHDIIEHDAELTERVFMKLRGEE